MFGSFSREIGIDLGTANTLVYVKGQGIVVREPSVVAFRTDTGKIEAVGNAAKNMIGRTPGNVTARRPMKDGVIADYETTATMIKYFMDQASKKKGLFSSKTNVMICVPSGSHRSKNVRLKMQRNLRERVKRTRLKNHLQQQSVQVFRFQNQQARWLLISAVVRRKLLLSHSVVSSRVNRFVSVETRWMNPSFVTSSRNTT